MPVLAIGEYRPDVSSINAEHSASVLNVLPRSDGYGPMKDSESFTSALADDCRGGYFARASDGSVIIFAATATRLYRLDNTDLSWIDVSKGGSAYSSVVASRNWSFTQFNTFVIACHGGVPVQVYQIGVSSAFADLGGSPPQAGHVATVGRFVLLSDLTSNPGRVQWSGLNAVTTWTSGTTYSDYQDMPDGGNVLAVAGGETGLIVQDSALRRMVWSPGSDVVFQIDRIASDIGGLSASSIIESGGRIYFPSTRGFVAVSPMEAAIEPIGKEKVDRTWLSSYDTSQPQMVIGSTQPDSSLVFWAYRTEAYNGDGFNKMLAYDTALKRFAPVEKTGNFLLSLSKPGITLESLATIGSVDISGAADNGSGLVRLTVTSTTGWTTGDIKDVAAVTGTTEANGTWTITVVDGTHIDLDGSTYANAYVSGGYVAGSLDDLDFSLDDISSTVLSELALIDDDLTLAYFTGTPLEATVETADQTGYSQRLFVRGLWPITDAGTAYGSVGKRESVQETITYSTEAAMNARGFVPQRASTRVARGRIRIPAGTEWTFISGVEPDFVMEGAR